MSVATATPEVLSKRLLRGALGGVVSGLAFIAVTMWFASSVGDPANGPLMMISTIVLGDEAMAAGTANPTLGMAVHLALAAAFGMIFAVLAPFFKTNGSIQLAGGLYGLLLYVVNFWIFAPTLFPVFKMANQPFELVVHVVFGHVLAFAFFSSGVRRREPIVALTEPAFRTGG